MNHPFFAELDFAQLVNLKCRPPWVPDAQKAAAGSYLDEASRAVTVPSTFPLAPHRPLGKTPSCRTAMEEGASSSAPSSDDENEAERRRQRRRDELEKKHADIWAAFRRE